MLFQFLKLGNGIYLKVGLSYINLAFLQNITVFLNLPHQSGIVLTIKRHEYWKYLAVAENCVVSLIKKKMT